MAKGFSIVHVLCLSLVARYNTGVYQYNGKQAVVHMLH